LVIKNTDKKGKNMSTTVKNKSNGFEISNPKWTCQITDGEELRNVKLGIYIDIEDRENFDDEFTKGEYPYLISAYIVPLPESITEEGMEKITSKCGLEPDIELIHDCYCGVYFDIDTCKSINEDFTGLDCQHFGSHLTFMEQEEIEKFINKIVVHRIEGIMVAIGFILDEPTNPIGTTGWQIIESIIYGDSFMDRTLVQKSSELPM
jgi:hypothetical protein